MEENKVETLEETPTTPEPVVETMEPVTDAPSPAPEEPVTEAPTTAPVETPSEPTSTPAEVPSEAPSEAAPTEPAAPAPEEKPAEKKKGKGGILLVLIILVLAIFAVWFFVLGGNEMLGLKKAEEPPNQEEEKKEEQKEEKVETVELSEEEYEKLIGYIPFEYRYENKNDTYSPFDSKKITLKEMDTNWLVEKAMRHVTEKGDCTEEQFQLNGICNYTISKENVSKAFRELYGDVDIEFPNVVNLSPLNNTCTLDKNNIYACGMEGGGITSHVLHYFDLPGARFFTRYQKAEKDGKNLYVYVKYAKLEMVYDESNPDIQAGDITFRIRKYGTGNEVIDETILNGADYFEEYDGTDPNFKSPFYDKLYEQFKDKLTTYKLTYAIDGDSYHLTSVEPV